jgi:hypothetical protein
VDTHRVGPNAFNAKAPSDFETYGSLFGASPNAVNNGTLLNPSMHRPARSVRSSAWASSISSTGNPHRRPRPAVAAAERSVGQLEPSPERSSGRFFRNFGAGEVRCGARPA